MVQLNVEPAKVGKLLKIDWFKLGRLKFEVRFGMEEKRTDLTFPMNFEDAMRIKTHVKSTNLIFEQGFGRKFDSNP